MLKVLVIACALLASFGARAEEDLSEMMARHMAETDAARERDYDRRIENLRRMSEAPIPSYKADPLIDIDNQLRIMNIR